MINSEGKLREEISQRIQKATAVYNQLGKTDIIVGKQELTTKTEMASIQLSFVVVFLSYSPLWQRNFGLG